MSTKAYGITSGGVIKCSRVALIPASRGMRSTAGWALFHCVESGWHLVRELSDEIQSESRMREIRTSGLMSGERKRATASRPRTAPFLDSTGQRQSAIEARSAHALRSGGLGLPLQPCGAPRADGPERTGLPALCTHRAMAHLGPAHLALGKVTRRAGRLRSFRVG